MNPSHEQLIRDYLNRVAVAARGRLTPDERQHFLARTRESVEREVRHLAAMTSAEVGKLLAGLGEPAALVDQEEERLAAARAEGPAEPRLGHPMAHPAAWLSRRAARRRPVYTPPPASPADETPLTGEIKIEARPITARRRPGAPLQPRQPRQSRRRRGGTAAGHPADQAGDLSAAGATGTDSDVPYSVSLRPRSAAPASGQHDDEHPSGGSGDGPLPGGAQPSGGSRGPAESRRPGGSHDSGGSPGSVPPEEQEPDEAGLAAASGPPAWPDRPARQASQSRLPARTAGQTARPVPPPASALPGDAAALLGTIGAAAVKLARRHPLEAAAIVVLGLGGVIYPPIWLLGAVVALLSTTWDFRDKWAGLAGPPLLVIVGAGAVVALGGRHATFGGYAHEAWTFADYMSRVLALLGAAYLTWRVGRGRRPPATPPWNRPHRI